MNNLQLATYTQGIRGGKGKSTECGYSLMTAKENGHDAVQISIDTFEGSGQTYKQRENLHIEIYFAGFEMWKGTPEQLKQLINPAKL